MGKRAQIFRIGAILLWTVLSALSWIQGEPTFSARVSQVVVDAQVVTADGQPIIGLHESDFRVIDNGRDEQIVAVRTDEIPLDVVLLLDVSGSMRKSSMQLGAASQTAVHQLRPGDRVAIMPFTTSASVFSGFSENLELVRGDIEDVCRQPHSGGTRIHQAVYDAANYLLGEPHTDRRKAIIIVTDNESLQNKNEMSVVRRLWEADAVLSGVIVHHPRIAGRWIAAAIAPYMIPRMRGMDNLVKESGGYTLTSDDLASALPEILRRIRSSYRIYYRAPVGVAGEYRRIDCQLSAESSVIHPGGRVYARRGYRLEFP